MFRQIHAVYLKCLFSLVLFLVITLPVLGQSSSTASITGIVQDTTDARIPNAGVKLINTQTGTESTSKTNKDGDFLLPNVMPGQYTLQIERDGFATTQLTGLVLNVGDTKNLLIRLKVGSQDQTITVDGSGLILNTTDASVGTVIDRHFVENIPLNGRSFQDLISLSPGVVTQSPQTNTSRGFNGDFSVNGQRTESNYYTIDGVSGNIGAGNGAGQGQAGTGGTLAGSTALGTTQSLLSVDALQEFRVQTSTYSAEYGRSPGGQFDFVTRSGTNTIHGSAFDYLRNNFFDANDWFNDYYGRPITALRQNDFGGTVGGPIWIPRIYNGRDKTFFFVSYEGLRLTEPQAASLQYVPSTSLRQGAPPALQPILNAYPQPTGAEVQIACNGSTIQCPVGSPIGTPVPSGLSPFIEAYSLPGRIDSTSVRIDHTFAPRLTVFFRYGNTPSENATRTLSSLDVTHANTQTYTFGATSSLSPKLSNEFRLGYANALTSTVYSLDAFGGATPIDLGAATGASATGSPYSFPVFYISIPGVGTSELSTKNSNNISYQWNAVDAFTASLGSHKIKVGIDYRHITSPLNPASPTVEALYESRQSLLNNQALEVVLENTIGSEPVFTQFAAFAQDEWQVSHSVSLSLGLRWELSPSPSESHGNDAFTLLGNIGNPSSLALAPRGTSLWSTTLYNFAPRLGVAWQAHQNPGWETVFRAGGGIFFDTNGRIAALGYTNGIGFSATSALLGAALPVSSAQLNFSPSTSAPYTSAIIYAFPDHLQLPYTLEWSSSLEQALGKNQAFTLSYLGSNGRRLSGEQELSLTKLNPNFGTVIYFPSNITSNYQALQVQFQRTVTTGLHAIGSYTWSHSIDLGSNATTLPITRGNSDFDVRSNFTAGLSWDIAHVPQHKLAGILLGGWGLDGRVVARTSFPITLAGNTVLDSATGSYFYGGVNIVPNQPIYLYGPQYPGGKSLNKAAFSLPTGTNVGNAPRNFARGFGEAQINLAARRDFKLHDNVALQFRAESFNILNHPNFGVVDYVLTDATFGQALQMLNQSLNTVASQYQQGGPRSMQFALKLIF